MNSTDLLSFITSERPKIDFKPRILPLNQKMFLNEVSDDCYSGSSFLITIPRTSQFVYRFVNEAYDCNSGS